MKKYSVLVSAHGPNFYFAIREVQGETLEECETKVKEIIRENNIPADTWTGGMVMDLMTKEVIGNIDHKGVFNPNK